MSLHPLQNTWSFWHDTNWSNLQKFANISNVEHFWCLFDTLPKLNDIKHKTNIRIFHDEIHPSREDPSNVAGGTWILQFYRNSEIDDVLLELLLIIIGNTLDEHFEIVGLELNIRDRGHRIQIWTKNCDISQQKIFGHIILKNAGISLVSLQFKSNIQIASSTSSFVVKPLITLK